MRRRNLFTLAAGVSAVVWLATVVLWGIAQFSERHSTRVSITRISKTQVVRIDEATGWNDRMVFARAISTLCQSPDRTDVDSVASAWPKLPSQAEPGLTEFRIAFNRHYSLSEGPGSSIRWYFRFREIVVPFREAAFCLGVLPCLWALTRFSSYVRQRRAPKKGQCRQCGYDLRATPERCPECGAVPAARSGSAAG